MTRSKTWIMLMPTSMSFSILLLFATAALSQSSQEPVDLLIRGGTVVTMDDDERVLDGGAVAIRGNTIAMVLTSDETMPEAAETIDASGHLVIPGLVNTHGHVAMTLLRGIADDLSLLEWLENYIFPAEAKNVSPEFVYWGSLLGCVEMARSGTTTFVDMYFFEDEVAKATEKAGLRGVLGQTVIGFPAPDFATPEEAIRGAELFFQRYQDHPLVVPSIAPHALYTTSLDLIQQSHRLARRYDLPFQIHAVEPPEENDQMLAKYGKRTIHALDDAGILTPGTILHHGIWLSDEDIERIRKGGASISHNPESNMKTASGLARVPDLLREGIAVGLGTDGVASNNNLDMFEEMDTAAKVHKLFLEDPTVMPAKTVFHMATRGGAEALGLEDRIGSLSAGKLADVVLVNVSVPELTPMYDAYSHLVYAVKGAHVSTVIVNGQVVMRDREMLTVNVDEVLTKAREMQRAIQQSLSEK